MSDKKESFTGTVLKDFSIFYGKKEKKYKEKSKFETESKEVFDFYVEQNKIK